MVQDDPEDLVQELHMKHTLGSHPLGRPILGQAPRIQALGRNDLVSYVGSHYDPERTVVAVAGNFTWRRLEQLLARYFSDSHKGVAARPSRRPPEVKGGVLVKRKSLLNKYICAWGCRD
jgi:predicted Zn-dependent peptidase